MRAPTVAARIANRALPGARHKVSGPPTRDAQRKMKANGKRLMLGAALVYSAAFAILYAIAYRASLLPAISEVSLSCALDTVGKRIYFAAEGSLWGLIILSPLIFWWAKKEMKMKAEQGVLPLRRTSAPRVNADVGP